MFEIKIHGLQELHKTLQELPATIERNVLRGGLKAAGEVIKEEARRRVSVESGALRDSIRVSMRVRTKAGWVNARVKAGSTVTKKRVSARANGGVKVEYDNPWYAHLVEFGTARHYIKAKTAKALILRGNKRASSGFAKRWTSWIIEGVDHPGARPKPFMRPAFDAKAQAAIEEMADYIRQRLPRELKKAGK